MFRDTNTNGKTVRKNKVISIKDNTLGRRQGVNSREEAGGTHREFLEFGKVLFLALCGNYVGPQTAIILSAVFSYPWSFQR